LSYVKITAGPYEFLARFEREKSPKTCEAFERLLPYQQKIIHVRWSGAGTIFASKLGRLAGNHFLTVVEGKENLRALGEMCLWEGAQDIVFERA
jgi:hypothetical protein